MDFTKLFLGDALNDDELVGLNDMNLNLMGGADNDTIIEEDDPLLSDKSVLQESRDQKSPSKTKSDTVGLLSDSSSSEEEKVEQKGFPKQKVEQRQSVRKKPKQNLDELLEKELNQANHLPILYTDAEGNRAIKMSEVFVPDQKLSCQNVVRNRMLMYNDHLMGTNQKSRQFWRVLDKNSPKSTDIEESQNLLKNLMERIDTAQNQSLKYTEESKEALDRSMQDFQVLQSIGQKRNWLQKQKSSLPSYIEKISSFENSKRAKLQSFETQQIKQIQPENFQEFKTLKKIDWRNEAQFEELKGQLIIPEKTCRYTQNIQAEPDIEQTVHKSIVQMSKIERQSLKKRIRIRAKRQLQETFSCSKSNILTDTQKQCYIFILDLKQGRAQQFVPEVEYNRQNNYSSFRISDTFEIQNKRHIQNSLKNQRDSTKSRLENFFKKQNQIFEKEQDNSDILVDSSSQDSQMEQSGFDIQAFQSHQINFQGQNVEKEQEIIQTTVEHKTKIAIDESKKQQIPDDLQMALLMEKSSKQFGLEQDKAPKYWGELLTCPSKSQIIRNVLFQKRKQGQRSQNYRDIFKLECAIGVDRDQELEKQEDIEIQKIKDSIKIQPIYRLDEQFGQNSPKLLNSTLRSDQSFHGQDLKINENFDQIFQKQRLLTLAQKQNAKINGVKIATGNQQDESKQLKQFRDNQEKDARISQTSFSEQQIESQTDNFSVAISSKQRELNHAVCATDLAFTTFEWSQKQLTRIHRPDILSHFMKNNRFQKLKLPKQVDKEQQSRLLNSDLYFKDQKKLQLKKGEFAVFEHLDQNPLFLTNFGMVTQLKRFVITNQITVQEKPETVEGCEHLGPYGSVQNLRNGTKSHSPLLAQISLCDIKGLTIAENKLYKAPLFYHNLVQNEEVEVSPSVIPQFFFCAIQQGSGRRSQAPIIIRPIKGCFSVGQQEPKYEILNPYSRSWTQFIRQKAQTYIYKALLGKKLMNFDEAYKLFPQFGDQGLRKLLKESGIEIDRDHNLYAISTQIQSDSQVLCKNGEDQIPQCFRRLTLEQICAFESALFATQQLRNFGLQTAKHLSVDKISAASNRFCIDEKSEKLRYLCRLIEAKIMTTPWYLSQNFIKSKQLGQMLLLDGIGDPSNGIGGYSYLKMPLKVQSDHCMSMVKTSRAFINPAINNPKRVKGTDADLRKLTKSKLKEMLVEKGHDVESLQKISRWNMVAILSEDAHPDQQQESAEKVQNDKETDPNSKFARGERKTTKMQREAYQQKINELFQKQIQAHLDYKITQNDANLRDNDSSEKNIDAFNDLLKSSISTSDNFYGQNSCIFYDQTAVLNIDKIDDIPDFQRLLLNKQIQEDPKGEAAQLNVKDIDEKLRQGEITKSCKVLRRKIRSLEDGSITVVYTSSEKLINKFLKRKKSKKAQIGGQKSLREQKQDNIMSLTDISRLSAPNDHQSDFQPSQSLNGSIPNIDQFSTNETKQPGQTLIRLPINFDKLNEATTTQENSVVSQQKVAKRGRKKALGVQQQKNTFEDSDSEEDATYGKRKPRGRGGTNSVIKVNKQKKLSLTKTPLQKEQQPQIYEAKQSSKDRSGSKNRGTQSCIEVQNGIFNDIVDACINSDKIRLFTQKVKTKDAPDYFKIIKNPIDLSIMKGKARRKAYQSTEDFLADFEQLVQNSVLYNGQEHQVTKRAIGLQKIAIDQIQKQIPTSNLN